MRYALEFIPILIGFASLVITIAGYKRAKRKQAERDQADE